MAEKNKELKATGTTNYPDEKKVKSMLCVENMTKLKKKYDPNLIPEAKEKGDEGYLIVHNMVMDITKVRTGIEARRKEVKKDALDFGRLVDSKAEELTETIKAIEEPWKKLKTDLDEKEAKEVEEARVAEAKKIQIIEAKVEQLKSATNGLLGMPVEKLKERLKLITNVVIDESYGDYIEPAQFHKDTAITTLDSAIAEREIFEEEQAKVKRDQEELAAAQKEIDDKNTAKQKELDDNIAIAKKAQLANETEAQRLKDEAEAQKAAEKQRLEDEEFAALEEKQRKEKEAALYARLPEDVRMREYAHALLLVEAPELESEAMKKLVAEIVSRVNNIVEYVNSNTQDPDTKTDTV